MHACLEILFHVLSYLFGFGFLAMGFTNIISIGGPASCEIRVDIFIASMLSVINSSVLLFIIFMVINHKVLPYSRRLNIKRIRFVSGHSRMLFDSIYRRRRSSFYRTQSVMHYVMITPLLLMPWLLLLQMLFHSSSCPDSTNVTSGQKAYYWSVTGISLFVSIMFTIFLVVEARGEHRRLRYLGVQNRNEMEERTQFYHSAMKQLNKVNADMQDTITSVMQKGFEDDLTVMVQLRFWTTFCCWKLELSEARKLHERNICCKLCHESLTTSDWVVCLPFVANQVRLDIGLHQIWVQQPFDSDDESEELPQLEAGSRSLLRLSAKNMIEEVFHEKPSKWALGILERQGGVWTKPKAGRMRKVLLRAVAESDVLDISYSIEERAERRRSPAWGRVVHYSFLHRKCFQTKMLATRDPSEKCKELLPSNWKTALRWIKDEFEHVSASPPDEIPSEKSTVTIPRFYGILDKQAVKNSQDLESSPESGSERERMRSDSSD